jgi:uncharacterized membrane protein
MHTIFMVFVSFVAYATGVVIVQRWDSKGPRGAAHPMEALLALGVIVTAVFLWKPHYSLSYIAFCVLGMLFAGAVVGSVLHLRKKHAAAGTREYEQAHKDAGNLNSWNRWLNSSRAVVDYEFRLMLLACYFLIIGPFAIAFRLGRKESAAEGSLSAWVPRSETASMEAARRPF